MAAHMKILRNPRVIVILGCTGSGKSKLALDISTKYESEIISADSIQVYKGLDIITNKVTAEELQICPHHMIGFEDPLNEGYKVSDFSSAALPIIDRILAEKKLPIIVGGTNYYIEALLWEFLLHKPSNPACDVSTAEINVEKDVKEATSENDDESADDDVMGEGDDVTNMTDEQVLERLKEVDPASAQRIHPKDGRKLRRALQVFEQHGVTMTSLLADQHGGAVTSPDGGVEGRPLSGPLRYPNTAVFWVHSDLDVLDKRLDGRVDKMLERGLVEELTDFHRRYNHKRLHDKAGDYTRGIFQSIGFKEFHPYLILSEAERQTPEGQKLFRKGVYHLKLATRQYARRQLKWIRNRFLRKSRGEVPPVYRLDATEPEHWEERVLSPALAVLDALDKNTVPPVAPEAEAGPADDPEYHVCHVCDGRVFVLRSQWESHLKGRQHRNMVSRRHRLEREQDEPWRTGKQTGTVLNNLTKSAIDANR